MDVDKLKEERAKLIEELGKAQATMLRLQGAIAVLDKMIGETEGE